ncbi:MAG TPA: ankyrin repeat domain-containing protein, partial [Verrucomicrobiae bacterium]|nr:ankyrin repeat domain-containing protein [Verrucomicrobiae bacterium]
MKVEPLPAKPDLAFYTRQAQELARNFRAADPGTMYLIRQRHPRLRGRPNTNDRNPVTDDEIRRTKVTLPDARAIIAGVHHFESWSDFTRHIRELNRRDSATAQFEAAANAIVNGDAKTLQKLLSANPELIRMRSTREHRATLLHYVGSNGVEQYRQKTPKNIVRITKILLDAGPEIDADLDYGRAQKTYCERGGSTTLALAATSCHPADAGVQIELMDILIDHGASVEGIPGGWNPLIAALHNGRGRAAVHLAKRGAKLDLEGAAGTGRLAALKTFFDRNGSLKHGATKSQMEYGFMWACEYGHEATARFLLERGVDVAAMPHGETGLHWASFGGHARIVKTLLRWRAPLHVEDQRFGGTPLGWGLHGW